MAIPTDLPKFDANETDTTAPDTAREDDGFVVTGDVPEKPSYQLFNYLLNLYYKWTKYFKEREETLTHNMASDANYTLDADENSFGRVVITDTGVVLTTGRDIIFDTTQRRILVQNDTLQTLTFKTALGTGIAVDASDVSELYSDGVNIINIPSGLDIASTAEAQAGTNNTKAITPLRMREGFNAAGSAPVYASRTWVNFNGTGTVAIRASGNVSSITDNGTGDYTINFATALSDVNYALVNVNTPTSGSRGVLQGINNTVAPLTTSVDVYSRLVDTGAANDVEYNMYMIIR